MARFLTALLLALAAACTAASGSNGDDIELLPIADQFVGVDQTLVIDLVVNNPNGESLEFEYAAPSVREVERVAQIAGTPAGGEFRWTPLASQIGRHELTFTVSFAGGSTSRSLIVDVSGSADRAPVFVMAAGGAFDLERNPCVIFPVEVRDEDTDVVRIELDAPPAGADVDVLGPKSAQVIWCPTPDQTDVSLRWTLTLVADDGVHAAVRQDYLVVLRTPAKEGCAGDAPVVSIRQPAAGSRVASAGGYLVVADVTDDGELRESPLLYWTTDAVDFPDNPDLTTFQQVEFVEAGGQWQARVPSFGLTAGESRNVRFVVAAYDNDDDSGTACDHRTQTPLQEFVAVEGDDTAILGLCEACTTGSECASGFCVNFGQGNQCAAGCTGCTGACVPAISSSGVPQEVCAGCSGTPSDCTDDAAEDNDDVSSAAALPGAARATICPGDTDFWEVNARSSDEDITLTITFDHAVGDLDLRLRDALGGILDSSAGVENEENVSACVPRGQSVFAEVIGFGDASAPYDIEISRRAATVCDCDADPFEPNDTPEAAVSAPFGPFDASICPGDEDFFRLVGPGEVSIRVAFDGGALDLDVELLDPTGAIVASSRTTTSEERIEQTIGAGTHIVRIFPFEDGITTYDAEMDVGAPSGCLDTSDCPLGTICHIGRCEEVPCARDRDCPESHICPTAGPGGRLRSCLHSCFDSFDCRGAEACKNFPEGAACAETGRGAVGDSCTGFDDCGGRRACLDREGGYCAEAGCVSDDECDSGSWCVFEGGETYCAKDCGLGDFLCRTEYSCKQESSEDEELVFVCLP